MNARVLYVCAGVALWCAGSAALSGCASAAETRSTRMTVDDIELMTTEMAAQLRGSDWLRERTPESPPALVAIDKVENLTSDVIPLDAQWAMMARVRDAQAINALGRERNLRFTIPAEYLREGQRAGTLEPEFAALRRPTHRMDATLRSLTRAAGVDRTDLYTSEFRITNLGSGEVEWTGLFEFKRAAAGKAYD